VAARLQGAEQGTARTTEVVHRQVQAEPPGSVLVLGGTAGSQPVSWVSQQCSDRIQIDAGGFTVGGKSYRHPEAALLVTCRRRDAPDHVAALLYGVSPAATMAPARLLFFYGWNSYLVYEGGRVVDRGDFGPAREIEEIAIHAP
jgi:hypothetical protein